MALEPDPDPPPTVASLHDAPPPVDAPSGDVPAGEEPQRRSWREGPFRVHMPVDVRSVSLSIIAGAAILGVLKLAQPVIIPFVVSGLLFYALDPAVDWLQRWKMPRALGAALVLLIAIGGVGAGGYALSDDVMAVVNRLPEGARKLRAELRRPSPEPTAIDTMQQTAQELDQAAAEAAAPAATPKGVMRVQIEEPPLRASSYLWYGSMGALAIAGQAVMVAFLTYFLLVANDLFKRKLVKHVGETLARKKVTVQILDEISTQIERFLLVQMLTSVIVGDRDRHGVVGAGPGTIRGVGTRRRRAQHHSLLRSDHRHRRPGRRGLPAVRHHRAGGHGGQRRAGDHARSKAGC